MTIRIDYDVDAEDPCDHDEFKVVSFYPRHVSFEHPNLYHLPHVGLRRKLKCRTAFWLDYYEHGLCRWSLSGEGTQCPWDTTNEAGILLWQDKPAHLGTTYTKRTQRARDFLSQYTNWANGSIYGYAIEDEGGEILDSCSGYDDAEALLGDVRNAIRSAGRCTNEAKIVGTAAWITNYHDL